MTLAEFPIDVAFNARKKRWTAKEFRKLADEGHFGERVELIAGEIVLMPAMNEPHAIGILRVQRALLEVFGVNATVRVQLPFMTRKDTQVFPDSAVVSGNQLDAPPASAPPSGALLIVEIADTTYLYDRYNKGLIYASAGVKEYWIVNLSEHSVEVHRQPRKGRYSSKTDLYRGDRIAPLAHPRSSVPVAELLPVASK